MPGSTGTASIGKMKTEIRSLLDEGFENEAKGEFGRAADCFLSAAALVEGLDCVPAEVLIDDDLLCRWVVGSFASSDFGFASGFDVQSIVDPLSAGLKLASLLPDRHGEIEFWQSYFMDQVLGNPVQNQALRDRGLILYKAIYEGDSSEGWKLLSRFGCSPSIRSMQLRGHLEGRGHK